MNTIKQPKIYLVGDFKVYPDSYTLVDADNKSSILSELTFSLLMKLIEESPSIVSQTELIKTVWGNYNVSDETLQQRIKLLRQALVDSPSSPKYIQTIRNKGYKLIAPVQLQEMNVNQADAKTFNVWKYVAISLTLVFCFLFIFWAIQNKQTDKATDLNSQNSISKIKTLVLPLQNLDGSEQKDTFTQRLSKQLLLAISLNEDIDVINLGNDFIPANQSIQLTANELGATHVIFGKIDRRNDQIFVQMTLQDSKGNKPLWKQNITVDYIDNSTTQVNIVQKVISSLNSFLANSLVKMPIKPNGQMTAYDYLLKADDYLNRLQKADVELAIELSKKSIELDPQLALAHYTLGMAYLIYQSDWDGPITLIDDAIDAAEKTIEADPGLSHGYFLLGMAYQSKGWIMPTGDWHDKALLAYQQALKINPDDVNAKNAVINHYNRYKEFGKVLKVLYTSLQRHPDSVHIHEKIGFLFEELNYNDVAKTWYEKALLIQPDYLPAMMRLSTLYQSLGDNETAMQMVNIMLSRYPEKSDYLFQKANIYLFMENFSEAKKFYHLGVQNIGKDYQIEKGYYIYPYINLAFVYLQTGQPNEARNLMAQLHNVIETQMSEFPKNNAENLAQQAMIALLMNDQSLALQKLSLAVDEGFISDDWLQVHPLFKPLVQNGKLNEVLIRIDEITQDYRKQVIESGILETDVIKSMKSSSIN